MITRLELFDVYGAMARHAVERQRVSATNISNADTPGYKAVEVESFEAFMQRHRAEGAGALSDTTFRLQAKTAMASPNGNTVVLEQAIFDTTQAAGQHTLAMNVYGKSLDLLRAAIGKGR